MVNRSDINTLATEFWANGFLHLPDFFSEAEFTHVQRSLQGLVSHCRSSRQNYWAASDNALHMLFSERVLSLARVIIGQTPVFFGRVAPIFRAEILDQHYPVNHSAFQPYKDISAQRFLHIDAKGTEESLFQKRTGIVDKRYPVIRFAHFFQDHSRYSYGIKLAPCTHVLGDPGQAKQLLNPPVRPGDLLVFNLKLVHSAMCLRHLGGKVLRPEDEDRLESESPESFMPCPLSRHSLWWDFCDDSRVSELFIRNRSFYELDQWGNTGVSLDTVPELQRLQENGSLSLRYDTEIASLMTRKITQGLSHASKARLKYLEAINPDVEPFRSDVRRFAKEVQACALKLVKKEL